MTNQIRIVLTLDGKQYSAELDRATAETRKLERGAADLERTAAPALARTGTSATLLAEAATAAGVAFGLFGAVQLARQLSQTNIEFDRSRIALAAVSASSEQAAERFQFVLDTADRLGLSSLELTRGYAQVTAAARGTNLEGAKTDEIFSAIVEAGGRLNLSQADTQGILRATSQILSKGTLSAEELRQQLGDRLPGAFNIAARAMNVTTAELNEMLVRGEIAADEFLPKFGAELRRTFGTDATTRIDTTAASFQRLRNEIGLLADEIGGALNPVLAAASNVLANAARLMRGERGRLGENEVDLGNGFSRLGERYLFRAAAGIPRSASEEEIRALQAQQLEPTAPFRDFSSSLVGTITGRFNGSGSGDPPTPEFFGALRPELLALNEEQRKAVDLAREQLELLRLTTEEERVMYQIRYGSLRETTKQEQDFLLGAARLRDAQDRERKSALDARRAERTATQAEKEAARLGQRGIEEATREAEQDLQRALRAEEQARDRARALAEQTVAQFDPERSGRGFRRDLRDATSEGEISEIESAQLAKEQAFYRQQIDNLQNQRDEILQIGVDYNALEVQAWREHELEKTRISREAGEARRALMAAQADVIADIFGNLAGVAESFGRKGFEAYKAFAIVEATASMISGAVGAFARASAAYPPPVGQAIGAAAAAAVIAASTVKIAQIRALQFGGGRERGGAVSRDRFYEIGERGRPEIVESGGRFFMFDAQGRVDAARSGGGAGGMNLKLVFHNAPADTSAEMGLITATEQIVNITLGRVRREIAEGDQTAGVIARRFGLRTTPARGR